MKKKFVSLMLMLLLVGTFGITLEITPVALGDASNRKEVWKLVNVTNSEITNTFADINVIVNTREGVNIACSTSITNYFENPGGYGNWMEWLNGTITLPYNWGEMDWYLSSGSLTSITFNEIQQWGDMYADSGGGVSYWTFMDNTYMADWNLTATYNDPDIISISSWTENNITIIEDLWVPAETTISIVFKIVITEPGVYTFNVTSPQGKVEISPSSNWVTGGVGSLVVGKGPAYVYNTIQEAMNATGLGQTIYVAAGSYNEQVRFTKPVTVTSFTGDAASGGVMINPNDSEFEGPVSGHMVRAAVTFEAGSSGSVLRGVTIENSNASDYLTGNQGGNSGIEVIDGGIDNVIVQNVNVSNVAGHGFGSYDTNHPWPPPSGWLIDNCTFSTTGTDTWSGMRPENMENLTIQDCNVGPTNYGGILLINVNNAVVQRNRVHNTVRAGIQVDSYCTGAIDVLDNEVWATNSYHGADYGDVRLYGQQVPDPHGDAAATVAIRGNTLRDGYNGICVKSGQNISTRAVVVRENNILNHSNYGALNAGTGTLYATYNWWGNETGPYHPESNPSGKGDNVSNNVDFKPWLVKPYAPGQVFPMAAVFVDPPYINQTGPAIGTTFTVDVNVANVSMLYAFQFDLRWNTSLLDLANYVNRTIPNWTRKSVLRNNITDPGNYSLAVTALPPSLPFNGSTTLASLTFEIIYVPVYSENVSCSLALENVEIADSDAEPIVHLAYGGNYSCYSTKTKLVLTPQDSIAYKVPTEFDVDVDVVNVADLYAFEFELTYNTTLVEVIVGTGVDIVIPCYSENITLSSGRVFVRVEDIYPSAQNGTRTLVTIPFKVKGFVWNTNRTSANCTLAFSSHELNSTTLEGIQHDAVDGTYRYTPIPGDLNMDGIVDIFDIILAARAFGSEPPLDPRADLNCDGKVDILDIVKIAVNFGREEP